MYISPLRQHARRHHRYTLQISCDNPGIHIYIFHLDASARGLIADVLNLLARDLSLFELLASKENAGAEGVLRVLHVLQSRILGSVRKKAVAREISRDSPRAIRAAKTVTPTKEHPKYAIQRVLFLARGSVCFKMPFDS